MSLKEIPPAEFAALVQWYRSAIAKALAALQTWQPRYAKWEPVYRDICQLTVESIGDVQAALSQFLDFAKKDVGPVGIGRVPALGHVGDSLRGAYERGDEAAIIILDYSPISNTITEEALRKLKRARHQLAAFIEGVQRVLEELDTLFPERGGVTVVEIEPLRLGAPHRRHLHVVYENDEQETQDRHLSFLCEQEAPFDPDGGTEDYRLESEPRPLLGPHHGRWIVQVTGAEGAGILVYESTRKIAFLHADEAITVLTCLVEEVLQLLPYTDPQLLSRHQEELEAIRRCAKEGNEIQALMTLLHDGGGEK